MIKLAPTRRAAAAAAAEDTSSSEGSSSSSSNPSPLTLPPPPPTNQPPATIRIKKYNSPKKKEESELDTKINICIDYSTHIYDRNSSNRIYQAAVHGFLQRYPNLMIIPCFNHPLATKFDLFS